MDYFEAHNERMKRHDKKFKELAKDLKDLGYEVLRSKTGLISFIHIRKDNTHLTIQFSDLPYRWQSFYDIDTLENRGSSRHYKTRSYEDGLWSAKDIEWMMVGTYIRNKDFLINL